MASLATHPNSNTTPNNTNDNDTSTILRQFHVTKLRSWRTGYPRRLVLYPHEFGTLDASTGKETNRWRYSSIQDAMVVVEKKQSSAAPAATQPQAPQAILLDVGSDKLKFQCHHPNDASLVLTALLQQQMVSGQVASPPPHHVFQNCTRWKRNGQPQHHIVLQVHSFGFTESVMVAGNRQLHLQQTYLYHNIQGLSFAAEQHNKNTVVIQFRHPKVLIYTLPDRAAAFCQALQQQARSIVVPPLGMLPSRTVAEWRQSAHSSSGGGTAFPVTKPPSLRRPQAIPRTLRVVPPLYWAEVDTAGAIVQQRSLRDLRAIVLQSNSNVLTLETSDTSTTTYHVPEQRDALCVSLWDAAPWAVVVEETVTLPYRIPGVGTTATTTSLLGAPPVPVQLLQRVAQPALHTWAILQGEFGDGTAQGDPEVKAYLQTLPESDPGQALLRVCREFAYSCGNNNNNNVDRALLSHSSVCKLAVVQALAGIVVRVLQTSNSQQRYTFVAGLLQVLQRLLRVQPQWGAELEVLRGYVAGFCQMLTDTTTVSLSCRLYGWQVLQAILTGPENSSAERDMETEFVNKNVYLQVGGGVMPAMVQVLTSSKEAHATSDLILMIVTDIVQSLLCSHQDTTSPEHFAALLDCLAQHELALLATLRSPTPYVLENTALLLHLLSSSPQKAKQGSADAATTTTTENTSIREAALSSGLVLEHFYKAVFSPIEGQRFLSRYLCSQWLTKRLIQRMVPSGFLAYLHMPALTRVEEEQLDALERDPGESSSSSSTGRLRSRIAAMGVPSKENFRIFFHVLSTQDSNLADLIWNTQTRRELRMALESEMEQLRREESRTAVAWNHQQFKVLYPSLDNEVNVGGVYMRLWLQAGDGFIRSWEEPVRLFEHLFRRFLCEVDRNIPVTVMCIRCLERLYAIHSEKIGPFTDMMILVHSMSSTRSVETQHRLLGLVASILGAEGLPENAEQLLNPESISQLCQFVAWGHTTGDQMGNVLTRVLGTQGRPMLTDGSQRGPTDPTANDVNPTAPGDSSCPAVWFVASTGRMPPPPETVRGPFRVSDLLRMMEAGEISQFDLVTTSQVEEYDLEGGGPEAQVDTGKWKRLNQVWQLRWQLCTDGTRSEIYSATDVAMLAIKSLTRLVDLHKTLDPRGVPYYPIPIAKRILSGSGKTTGSDESNTMSNPFPLLCQSLLCTDSGIVDEASQLITKLCEHNPLATSKLYLTGVFFFALNYTGSNYKYVAKLLHATHLHQHFRSGFAAAANEDELPMRERSILGNLLPEGLLFILSNYGFERFSEVFVANADTPEVIWTLEMRKHLIEMIHQHIGDFPLRLFQNNTTEYEYCPMPGVAYKKLEDEIFCHNYYLRNLCDEERFPEWPISEPVEVFRSCLEHFKKEVDRDGNAEDEQLEQARQTLNLIVGDGSKQLRKAYRDLARKFHPDKVSESVKL